MVNLLSRSSFSISLRFRDLELKHVGVRLVSLSLGCRVGSLTQIPEEFDDLRKLFVEGKSFSCRRFFY